MLAASFGELLAISMSAGNFLFVKAFLIAFEEAVGDWSGV